MRENGEYPHCNCCLNMKLYNLAHIESFQWVEQSPIRMLLSHIWHLLMCTACTSSGEVEIYDKFRLFGHAIDPVRMYCRYEKHNLLRILCRSQSDVAFGMWEQCSTISTFCQIFSGTRCFDQPGTWFVLFIFSRGSGLAEDSDNHIECLKHAS